MSRNGFTCTPAAKLRFVILSVRFSCRSIHVLTLTGLARLGFKGKDATDAMVAYHPEYVFDRKLGHFYYGRLVKSNEKPVRSSGRFMPEVGMLISSFRTSETVDQTLPQCPKLMWTLNVKYETWAFIGPTSELIHGSAMHATGCDSSPREVPSIIERC